jgi:cephalosporin hydroxylase
MAREQALNQSLDPKIRLEEFADSLKDPLTYYLKAYQEFHTKLPNELRDHRRYFSQQSRGLDEDAFHVMWWNLVQKFQPSSFLEIGVYRGQTLSLVALASRIAGHQCEVTGISPFDSIGDSVSKYSDGLDYLEGTLKNFGHFQLPRPNLVKAYYTDPSAVEAIRSKAWDFIYIDGNHDYEIVLKDWQVCSESIKVGGLIILDDSGLSTSYKPPAFATGGHPGPSRMATEIDPKEFKEILQMGHNRVFQRLV